MRQHQERSYVLALSGCGRLDGMYYSADSDGLSFRSTGDILLLGGNSHRTGKNTQGGAYAGLEMTARRYYRDSQVVCRWSAQDCMSHDDIPFVGKYFYLMGQCAGKGHGSDGIFCGGRDWYVATGYKKWGMSSAMAASLLLTDLVTGRENPYEKLFTPQRHHIKTGTASFEGYYPHIIKHVFPDMAERCIMNPAGMAGGGIICQSLESIWGLPTVWPVSIGTAGRS